MNSAMRVTATFVITALGCVLSVGAFAEESSPCGPIVTGGFGPFDYRTASAFDKKLVEGSHFTPDVQNLRKGESGYLAGDIDYTLRAFPNHPRALLAMSNLGQKQKTAKPAGARWSVDCYFERALRWRPDDPNVRLVLGIHLIRRGQKDAARAELTIAEESSIDDASFRYSLGLAFLDVGEPDRALAQAWRAYGQGYDLPGLRRRLEKIGKWREPEK